MPGPIPNRTSDLSRARDANRGDKPPVTKGQLRYVDWPEPDVVNWSATALRLWTAARTSGQADYYQNSDVAMLYFLCEELSEYSKPIPIFDKQTGLPVLDDDGIQKTYTKRSPMMLQAIMSGLTTLMLTEGDRRKARIELEAEVAADEAHLYAIADYKDALGVSK